jgi:hypothetical protein
VRGGGSGSEFGEGGEVSLEKVYKVTAKGFRINVSVEPTFLEPITIQTQVPWLHQRSGEEDSVSSSSECHLDRRLNQSLTHPRTVALRSLH